MRLASILALGAILIVALPVQAQQPSVYPTKVRLVGKDSRQVLLIGAQKSGRAADRTRDAKFRSDNPAIAQVSSSGIVTAAGSGQTIIVVEVDGVALKVPVV